MMHTGGTYCNIANHYSGCHPNMKASHKSFSQLASSNICLISSARAAAGEHLPFCSSSLTINWRQGSTSWLCQMILKDIITTLESQMRPFGLAQIKMTPRSKKCMKWHFVDYKDYNINSHNYSRGSCGNFHLKARFIDIWLHQSRTVQLFCNLKDFYQPCIYFTFFLDLDLRAKC